MRSNSIKEKSTKNLIKRGVPICFCCYENLSKDVKNKDKKNKT